MIAGPPALLPARLSDDPSPQPADSTASPLRALLAANPAVRCRNVSAKANRSGAANNRPAIEKARAVSGQQGNFHRSDGRCSQRLPALLQETEAAAVGLRRPHYFPAFRLASTVRAEARRLSSASMNGWISPSRTASVSDVS